VISNTFVCDFFQMRLEVESVGDDEHSASSGHSDADLDYDDD
jgi:hypothetical protein